MKHTYVVNPPEHQPQWPTNDNKPEPSLLDKTIFVLGISFFALIFIGVALLGLFSMTVVP